MHKHTQIYLFIYCLNQLTLFDLRHQIYPLTTTRINSPNTELEERPGYGQNNHITKISDHDILANILNLDTGCKLVCLM